MYRVHMQLLVMYAPRSDVPNIVRRVLGISDIGPRIIMRRYSPNNIMAQTDTQAVDKHRTVIVALLCQWLHSVYNEHLSRLF
jgi:hypothetical protein